jgi:hypothetical protein
VRVIDQHPLTFCQDGIVRGIPRDSKALSHAGDGEVLAYDAFQPAAGELRSRLSSLGSVLPPNMAASGAAVTADTDQQNGRPSAEGFMTQPAGHGIPWDALGTALLAPLIRFHHPESKNSTVWIQTLPGDFQAKAVKPAESGQVRAVEGSVIHAGLVEEGSDLDNPILFQGPHLVFDQLNELQLTMQRRSLHPESGRAIYPPYAKSMVKRTPAMIRREQSPPRCGKLAHRRRCSLQTLTEYPSHNRPFLTGRPVQVGRGRFVGLGIVAVNFVWRLNRSAKWRSVVSRNRTLNGHSQGATGRFFMQRSRGRSSQDGTGRNPRFTYSRIASSRQSHTVRRIGRSSWLSAASIKEEPTRCPRALGSTQTRLISRASAVCCTITTPTGELPSFATYTLAPS